jgi:MYXO-CTERM domain-containing protein
VVAAGSAALALAGPMALRPFADVAGAAGEVTVAFVLDFGGPRSDQVTGCVTVPASDSRYDALAAFAAQERLALPTYNASGLLCSINGTPSSGCGQVVSGGYIYWSYFTGGTGAWSYADTGAFGTVTPGDVEGWRFQDPGTGLPNDPAPRTTPDYTALCAPARTPPGRGGGGRPARTPAGAAAHRARSLRSTKGGGSTTSTTSTSQSSTTTTSTYPPDQSSSDTQPDISIPPDPVVGSATVSKQAGGGGPDPIIVGGLLVAVLAVAAYARWRRRPKSL